MGARLTFLRLYGFNPYSASNLFIDRKHSTILTCYNGMRYDNLSCPYPMIKALRNIGIAIYAIAIRTSAIPFIILIRLITPWVIIRFGPLQSHRLGHFAANTELYVCEMKERVNIENKRYIDIFYLRTEPICNNQLLLMWKRSLTIWPNHLVKQIIKSIKIVPGWGAHIINNPSQHDRDIHNLLDKYPASLAFTTLEEKKGKEGLNALGIPVNAPFVCMTVRDDSYLKSHLPDKDHSYHSYRDSNIKNYVMAAEELAHRGYYVIRMGAKVNDPLISVNDKIIDYATNGDRTDFMDIYLGANCHFCISVGTGFDAVPLIFRKPIVYVNMVPLGYLFTFSNKFLAIIKHHIDPSTHQELSISDIISRNVHHSLRSDEYAKNNIVLIENSPHEIRDAIIEMADKLENKWVTKPEDKHLQDRFWKAFPGNKTDNNNNLPLHGEIRSRFGAKYLRQNNRLVE